MYDINNLNCMIECLEKYKHEYTKYEHRNGKCSIRTDLLLKQLKLNEKEIRNKAIDEFAEKMRNICKTHSVGEDKYTNEPIYAHEDGTWHSLIDEIAERMKEGAV